MTEAIDTIQMEYVTLPITDASMNYLIRFVKPFETIWAPYQINITDSLSDPDLRDLNKFGLSIYRKMFENIILPEGFILDKLDKISIHECDFVPK